MDYLIIILGCALGSGLNMVCGFGFGVVCMICLPAVMGSATGPTALINILTLFQSAYLTWCYRQHVRWRMLVAPLIAYFCTSLPAVRLAVVLDTGVMEKLLGAFLLALSIYFIFIAKNVRMKANTRNGLIAGGAGGVMSGMFAVGGPPPGLYFSATTEKKEEYLATIQAYYMLSSVYVVALRVVNGIVTPYVFGCTAVGGAGLVLGILLGGTIFKRVKVDFIRSAMYCMMAVSGVVMLLT